MTRLYKITDHPETQTLASLVQYCPVVMVVVVAVV